MRDGHVLSCWFGHFIKPGKGVAPHVTSYNFHLDQWTYCKAAVPLFLSKLYPWKHQMLDPGGRFK